ncbi:class I SAM-dependent methyltransferase [Desulfonatronovibrio magnus]|uniref:class I SAM-dependent methyltransferase n=1 Tax=Desulfonatronovibrio magnus TaxID=698827 RepID=UPI0005EBCF34|nr:methyltransferase domain-containing protein [Desulfonatronovibrio magnus]
MLNVYQIALHDNQNLSHEQILAVKMGRPPYDLETVSGNLTIGRLLQETIWNEAVFIFDPEFWYPEHCWHRWFGAILEKSMDTISVPLGNQNPAWRNGLDVPLYFTVSGLQNASLFCAENEWMTVNIESSIELCVAAVPRKVLRQFPGHLKLKNIPGLCAEKNVECQIFCCGWLHSFKSLGDAGCRHDLISMTDWTGNVLEVGCGAGLMAATCKEQNSGLRWVGVEQSYDIIKEASPRLDLAINADANYALPFGKDIRFDRIVCGDFLEHLPFPWVFLSRLRNCVADSGRLIASVPNIGHWSIVKDLFKGRFDEAPSGTLCVTHLRFGTKKSWEKWFLGAGWNIEKVEEERLPLPVEIEQMIEFVPFEIDRNSLATIRYRFLASPG